MTRSSTEVLSTASELRARLDEWRAQGLSVGLVPTMGALHDGHLSLVRSSRARDDRTAVSIFVNPLQFVAGEDLASYPRDLAGDLAKLEEEGVQLAFTPGVETMYPPGAQTRVVPGAVAEPLEGEHRPGHFTGVATVVAMLLNLFRPDRAYFGQKDAQQVAVVRALVRDLAFPVELVVGQVVRAPDGLALSSRNAYLGEEERRAAVALSRALRAANDAYLGGERDHERLRDSLRAVLDAEPLARVDYAEVVDPSSFRPPGPLAVLAVRIGRARLIDNHELGTKFGTNSGDW